MSSIEFLLSKGMKGHLSLEVALNNSDREKQKALFDLAFKYGATSSSFKNIWSSIENYNEDIFNLLINDYKVSAKDLFALVLKMSITLGPLSEESITKLKNLIDLTKLNRTDANNVFSSTIATVAIYESDDIVKNITIYPDIFKYLLENELIDATIALEYAIVNQSIDLANSAFNYQPNINAKAFNSSNLTLLDRALSTKNLDIINWILDKGVKHDVDYLGYLETLYSTSFDTACKIVEKLPEIYNQDKTYELLRANGASISQLNTCTDYYNLIVDYLAASHGGVSSLSELEQKILTADVTIDISATTGTSSKNIYGYTPLHLAIIASKYDLAQKMIEAGFDLYAVTNSGTSSLQLVSAVNGRDESIDAKTSLKQLKQLIAKKIDNVDILFDNGESLIDSFVEDPELSHTILSKTQDPLFHFYKPDSSPSDWLKDPDKIHIAISNGEGFWSSGIWATARLLMKTHKDVEFHLVTYEMLKKGGDNFIKQFDAFINPGAGDSYPEDLQEFTKKDCPFSMELEQLYQFVLQKTDELKIPYLGICAGAQHLALYHQGALSPLNGYNQGQHEIEFIKGSIPYFLSLPAEQQEQALKNGLFPHVKFKGDTAHHYAAINGKLGQDMKLGAISEHKVPMTYIHQNGIRLATQYHPEHHYTDELSAIHKKAWLDNFVAIARLHHNSKIHGTVTPSEYLEFVEQHLAQFLPDGEKNSVKITGEMPEGE